MWVCTKCSNSNYDNAMFCQRCGTSKPDSSGHHDGGNAKKRKWAIYATLGIIILGLTAWIVKLELDKRKSVETEIIEPEVSTSVQQVIEEPASPSPAVATPIPTPVRTMGPFSSGLFRFVNGASLYIPTGFCDTNSSGDYSMSIGGNNCGYYYTFANPDIFMLITLYEAKVSEYTNTGRFGSSSEDVLRTLNEDWISEFGTPSGNALTDNGFKLTGYNDSDIYYVFAVLDNNVIYTAYFSYPMENRSSCDQIVERVEASFVGVAGTAVSSTVITSRPSAADLEAIHADVVYPHSDSMYLPEYKYAEVVPSAGKTAVYAFKDPDTNNDPMRSGNYFTVDRDTKVIILAESSGYACVIIDDSQKAGWINSKYLTATA